MTIRTVQQGQDITLFDLVLKFSFLYNSISFEDNGLPIVPIEFFKLIPPFI